MEVLSDFATSALSEGISQELRSYCVSEKKLVFKCLRGIDDVRVCKIAPLFVPVLL